MKINKIKEISLVVGMFSATTISASGAFAGATEPTQIVRMTAELLDRAADYVEMVSVAKNTISQLETMKTNLETLGSSDWLTFESAVKDLEGAVTYQQAVTYVAANYESKFKSKYKGYAEFKQKASGANNVRDYEQEYANINQSTRDTVQSSLKQMNLSYKDMEDDEAIVAKLKQSSKSAKGQRKAMQVASQIALHTTAQLKKLQRVLLANTQLHAAYIAKKTADDAMKKAAGSNIKPAKVNQMATQNNQKYPKY